MPAARAVDTVRKRSNETAEKRNATGRCALHSARTVMKYATARALSCLDAIDDPFKSALLSMYQGEPQLGHDGQTHQIDEITKISPSQARALYDFCEGENPKSIIEIGMAYGFSSIIYSASLQRHSNGRLISIDPFQKSAAWHGIGDAHVRRLLVETGQQTDYRLIEDRSDRAAVDLARASEQFDLIFIDGNHRFDDVLTDFYLFAPLCQEGGHIIFDDMWMPSIRTVVSFISTNRTDFRRVPNSESNMCVFQCVGSDDRSWDNFNPFEVGESNKRWFGLRGR